VQERAFAGRGTSVAVASAWAGCQLITAEETAMKKTHTDQNKRLDLRRETLRAITGGSTTRPTMEPPSDSTNVWCATSTRPTSNVHCL
jgi:hypothetical protein